MVGTLRFAYSMSLAVIASEAIHISARGKNGLLRRCRSS
jgi:hypothetical protein